MIDDEDDGGMSMSLGSRNKYVKRISKVLFQTYSNE